MSSFHDQDQIVGAAGNLWGLVVLVDDVPGSGHAREHCNQQQNRQRAAGHERRSRGTIGFGFRADLSESVLICASTPHPLIDNAESPADERARRRCR